MNPAAPPSRPRVAGRGDAADDDRGFDFAMGVAAQQAHAQSRKPESAGESRDPSSADAAGPEARHPQDDAGGRTPASLAGSDSPANPQAPADTRVKPVAKPVPVAPPAVTDAAAPVVATAAPVVKAPAESPDLGLPEDAAVRVLASSAGRNPSRPAIGPAPLTPEAMKEPAAGTKPERRIVPQPQSPAAAEEGAIKPRAERMPVLPADTTPAPLPPSGSSAPRATAPKPSEPAPAPVAAAVAGSDTAAGHGVEADGGSSERGSRDGTRHESRGSAVGATEAAAAEAPVTEPVVNASRALDHSSGPVRDAAAGPILDTDAPVQTAATDTRFEPMRRAADRVTLRFEGEGGLEGRLRIAVRGETLHASILSSHDGTLEKLGGELGGLRQALRDQGFADARISVTDTRQTLAAANESRNESRSQDERRQGEPSRQKPQGREERPEGQGSDRNPGRRTPRQGRPQS